MWFQGFPFAEGGDGTLAASSPAAFAPDTACLLVTSPTVNLFLSIKFSDERGTYKVI